MVVGVFEELRREHTDPITSGNVIITQSSYWSDKYLDFSGSCLVNDDPNCFFCTKNISNSYLIIQIVNNPISIQGIKLGSKSNDYAPVAWSLEGSNDGRNYEPIFSISEPLCDKFESSDYHKCDGQFNKTYNMHRTKQFEYFKLSQIGTNTALHSTRSDRDFFIYSFRLSLLEFYLVNPINMQITCRHTFIFQKPALLICFIFSI